MAAFAQAQSGMSFPTGYPDAVPGLRLRIFDQNENEVPDWVGSVEVAGCVVRVSDFESAGG